MNRITPDRAREIVALDDARTAVGQLRQYVRGRAFDAAVALRIYPVVDGGEFFPAPEPVQLNRSIAAPLLDQLEALLDKRLAEMEGLG
jgi:hypothetical protein